MRFEDVVSLYVLRSASCSQTQILTRYALSLRAPTHLAVRKTRNRVKKPAKKVVKKAAAKKAPAKPRKTAAERRAEEMRWYRHHTSYDAFYQEAYDDDAEEARDRLEGKGYRIYDIDDCIDLKEIAAYAKSSALSEWLRCKSAEEMQAAIDSTNVPMPAAIKKQAKERIKVLQEEASRGIERPRAVMRSDVREQRRTELEESLHRRHPDLHIRDDSKMCDSYLNLRWVVSFRIPLFFVRPSEDSVCSHSRTRASFVRQGARRRETHRGHKRHARDVVSVQPHELQRAAERSLQCSDGQARRVQGPDEDDGVGQGLQRVWLSE